MPKFVDMPHKFSFDIEELLYYRVSYGDTWMEEKENGPLLPTEHDERVWQAHQPMKLLLHFKNGTELEIPDFEMSSFTCGSSRLSDNLRKTPRIPLKEKLIHSEASTLSKAKLPNSSR